MNLKPWFIQNPVKYIQWSILFRTFCNYSIYQTRDTFRIFRNKDIQNNSESLKYSLHRILCSLGIFTTLVYSNPSILRIRGILETQSNIYDVPFSIATLCNTGIFRTQGIFRTLSNTYYGEFYSESCVTLAYFRALAYLESKSY